jgi:hypothetical protein
MVLSVACGGDRAGPQQPSVEPPGSSGRLPPRAEAPAPPGPPGDAAADAGPLFERACAGSLAVSTAGRLPTDLTSISGLAASHRHPGVVWAVEDSFEPAELVALSPSGEVVARIGVTGPPLPNLDWEALSVDTRSDGTSWVHIGDVGDNLGVRRRVRVLSFPEPDLVATSVAAATTELTYPNGRPNAEAMVVVDRTVWVLDKVADGPATLYRAELVDRGGRSQLTAVGELDLPGESVTAMDLSADRRVLAVRTQRAVRLYRVDAPADLAVTLAGPACATPPPPEGQGESVAVLFDASGLLTVSEDESGGAVDLHLTAPG